MVRGNWQRRVELNESRRNEAKLKKQRNEERKVSKAKLNELLAMMDRNKDVIWAQAQSSSQQQQRQWEIHIWTDTLPSDAPPVLDLWESDGGDNGASGPGGGNNKRRNRSASIDGEGSTPNRGKNAPGSGKKKAHPRSKETIPETETDTLVVPRLCRYQFFSGKCTTHGGKKSGGCRHVHYPNKHTTISGVLLGNTIHAAGGGSSSSDVTPSHVKELLAKCEAAHPDTQDGDAVSASDPGSIEMLYYSSINLIKDESLKEDKSPAFSDLIGGIMTKRACGLGSIVYLTINEHLLFDKYRDGVVISEPDFLEDACGVKNSAFSKKPAEKDAATILPGSVLEYILTFLPDTAVASMGCVCRAWNTEIGKQSAHLWKYLLNRRTWPIPSSVSIPVDSLSPADDLSDNSIDFRKAFLSHYSAIRDLNGIKLGLAGLLTKKHIQEKESCFRSFENLRGAPQYPSSCVSVHVWSPNRLLVGYSHDCTLRLFNTVEKSGSGGERLCRELICLCLDPYKNTKKRNCQIVAVALDDECIGCLFQVLDSNVEGEATMLSVLDREDFLLADGSIDEDAITTVDVGQSILNYILSCDGTDNDVFQINEFLAEGAGDLEEIEILVSQSIAACGYGRFLLEASISIPVMDEANDDDSDLHMALLFRKLFLFSSNVGAIVWMCASNPPTQPMRPRFENMTLATRRISEEDFRHEYRLTSCSTTTPELMSGSIGSGGDFRNPVLLAESNITMTDVIGEGWANRRTRHRPLILLASEVVVGDTFIRDIDADRKEFKSVLSFYPIESEAAKSSYGTCQLEGNLEVSSLVALREDHIIVIVRVYVTDPGGAELDDLDGQWFGTRTGGHVSLYAIVIDHASRSEIERICLIEDLEASLDSDIATSGELPFKISVNANTVGAAFWWRGVIMTGQEVRFSTDSPQSPEHLQTHNTPSKQKKKKKKAPKKGSKKDAFARGMSLRG